VFSGAAQVIARTRILGGQNIQPGETGWAQLRLADPIAVVRGDRFIIRQPSPSWTIGGGTIVDPYPRRRHRRFHRPTIERLKSLASDTPADIVLGTLYKQEPIEARRAVRRSQLEPEKAAAALDELIETRKVIVLDGAPADARDLLNSSAHLISTAGWARLMDRMERTVASYHATYPLRLGMPREEISSRLHLEGPLSNVAIERALAEGRIELEAGTLRLPTHRVDFTPEQQRKIDKVLTAFRRDPYMPPSTGDVEAELGSDVLFALLQQGVLEQVSEDVLFLTETYEDMVRQVLAHIREEGSVTVAEARDRLETSRKYALALLEHLDDERVTRRVGDRRVLARD
jgi:selenocysteine-specific elongation factor